MKTESDPARSKSPLRLFVLIVLAIAGGIVVGTRWHDTFGPALGLHASMPSKETATNVAGQLWTCSMHPQVLRDKPGQCPICHMQLTPVRNDAVADGTVSKQASNVAGTNDRKIKYWWDPMLNPPYISDKPGKSPMGMDLVPVYEDERAAKPGSIVIDPAVVQNMGVRVAAVTEAPLTKSIRLVGYLAEAQPNVHEINLRVSGWIRKLYVKTEGQRVNVGEPLFELYSPELQVAIDELINGRRAKAELSANSDEGQRQTAGVLFEAASDKLELFGLQPQQIDELAKLEKAPPTVAFMSPITGEVTDKPIVEGAAVKAGDRVLTIMDHTTLWIDAQVFEQDLPFVKIGQRAEAMVASRPAESLVGEIIFIHPHVDATTRTGMVRMSIDNSALALKPGMYAVLQLKAALSERAVVVPREAVIDKGDSQLAFVSLGGGKFEPRNVQMGPMGDGGLVQIVSGLSAGEQVATSGQFLLDSESRLREAIQKFVKQSAQHSDASLLGNGVSQATSPNSPERTAFVSQYLTVAQSLGMSSDEKAPVDISGLVSAAEALEKAKSFDGGPEAMTKLRNAVTAMQVQSRSEQRELFKAVSEQVIALASKSAAEDLYVVHCPMAKADWLQTTSDVANPYFGSTMKDCGSVTRVIKAQGSVRP